MSGNEDVKATITTVAEFPEKSFLENLAIRRDGSALVTVLHEKAVYHVPPHVEGRLAEPLLLHTFDQLALSMAEIRPEVFLIATSNGYTDHVSCLHRMDFTGWAPGRELPVETLFQFPDEVRSLNGMCLVAPDVLLVADCFAGLVWRIDVPADGRPREAKVWLRHPAFEHYPGSMKPEQPGVNGVRFAARTNHLYFSNTAKKLFMRIPIDPRAHGFAGKPELVSAGAMADDFVLDEEAGVAYVATHRENTIDRIFLDPPKNSTFRCSLAGSPFDERLIGPASGAWLRGAGDYGRRAYFVTDGGTTSPPPDGKLRPAKVLLVEFERRGDPADTDRKWQ